MIVTVLILTSVVCDKNDVQIASGTRVVGVYDDRNDALEVQGKVGENGLKLDRHGNTTTWQCIPFEALMTFTEPCEIPL